jgi:GNAT superfamily N-acetyltransferase
MTEVRTATLTDAGLVADIAARGFFADPVMGWVFPDLDARAAQLRVLFEFLALSHFPDGGTIHLLGDACTALWRSPSFDHADPGQPPERQQLEERRPTLPFPADVVGRLGAVVTALSAAHPHSSHWYLGVLSTVPERQSQGLGARTIAPVLSVCDRDGVPAYLESSNARNVPFYQRQGFVLTGTIMVEDGPTLWPMWRDPREGP